MNPDASSFQSLASQLTDVIMADTSDAARIWLTSALDRLKQPAESLELLGNELAVVMPEASRYFADKPVAIELPLAGEPWRPSHWSSIEVAQILIVLAALLTHAGSSGMTSSSIIEIACRYGDDRERAAIIKALYWLDRAGEMTLFAVDIGRTNSVQLFSAIALHNPYLAQHYSESQFNQLVFKSLFMGLNIEHVTGLRERKNSELMRMCDDYIRERRAARRPIPPSLWLTMDCDAMSGEILGLFLAAMASEDPDQRYFTARSLTWQANIPAPVRKMVRERLAVEPQTRIRELLAQVLD
ncbi:MAG: EboA domain-containing protein [Gammaproteobacteria bacterium]|nr:MAG: EboA domain-containing protein [Gammaproteobacteria bacterium]